jgi:hypothetical protein
LREPSDAAAEKLAGRGLDVPGPVEQEPRRQMLLVQLAAPAPCTPGVARSGARSFVAAAHAAAPEKLWPRSETEAAKPAAVLRRKPASQLARRRLAGLAAERWGQWELKLRAEMLAERER